MKQTTEHLLCYPPNSCFGTHGNPQEKSDLVGDDFKDHKAHIITKVVEVLKNVQKPEDLREV